MQSRTRKLAALATLCCATTAAITTASASAATGLGDPFFPKSGNAGYDVTNYDVALSYRPKKKLLQATDAITATATEGLTEYSLDLFNLKVKAVSVDGAPVSFRQRGGKVDVMPPAVISAGQRFTTTVSYRGRPGPIEDPDRSLEGWFTTRDGAIAFGEPLGTATWVACNNTPLDKASWTFRITAPKKLHGAANGRLVSVALSGGNRIWTWQESQPMAPYLAAMNIGRGPVRKTTSAGIPTWTTVDPHILPRTRRALARLPEIIRFEQKAFGPYPFDSAGSIVDKSEVDYALETQTRPTYGDDTTLITVVHETAHQWFGDSVGLTQWPDIWLNEGFATWAEWYWNERHGGQTARQTFRKLYAIPARSRLWAPPPAEPGKAKFLFSEAVYLRGGMALEALRMKVGTETFLEILRRWAALHQYGNATTTQFITLAENVSGFDLDPLFQRWLFKRGKPNQV